MERKRKPSDKKKTKRKCVCEEYNSKKYYKQHYINPNEEI
jgi:hypothetical protein